MGPAFNNNLLVLCHYLMTIAFSHFVQIHECLVGIACSASANDFNRRMGWKKRGGHSCDTVIDVQGVIYRRLVSPLFIDSGYCIVRPSSHW